MKRLIIGDRRSYMMQCENKHCKLFEWEVNVALDDGEDIDDVECLECGTKMELI
jgi:hypothetical protein